MLLTSVIIVLREVLEAALIISVLLALSRIAGIRLNWVRWAIGLGVLGSVIYASNTAIVSDWFDGVGQEVINALLQISVYVCLVIFAVYFAATHKADDANKQRLQALMTVVVSLAIVREGSEIFLYLSGFVGDMTQFTPILTGGLVGAGIGISAGALVYYLLLNLKRDIIPYLSTVLLASVAAGMAGQAALLLIQADWLPSQQALWDSSQWLPEDSVSGQLLYALIGYEASPTPVQAAAYFGGFLLLLGLVALSRYRRKSHADG